MAGSLSVAVIAGIAAGAAVLVVAAAVVTAVVVVRGRRRRREAHDIRLHALDGKAHLAPYAGGPVVAPAFSYSQVNLARPLPDRAASAQSARSTHERRKEAKDRRDGSEERGGGRGGRAEPQLTPPATSPASARPALVGVPYSEYTSTTVTAGHPSLAPSESSAEFREKNIYTALAGQRQPAGALDWDGMISTPPRTKERAAESALLAPPGSRVSEASLRHLSVASSTNSLHGFHAPLFARRRGELDEVREADEPRARLSIGPPGLLPGALGPVPGPLPSPPAATPPADRSSAHTSGSERRQQDSRQGSRQGSRQDSRAAVAGFMTTRKATIRRYNSTAEKKRLQNNLGQYFADANTTLRYPRMSFLKRHGADERPSRLSMLRRSATFGGSSAAARRPRRSRGEPDLAPAPVVRGRAAMDRIDVANKVSFLFDHDRVHQRALSESELESVADTRIDTDTVASAAEPRFRRDLPAGVRDTQIDVGAAPAQPLALQPNDVYPGRTGYPSGMLHYYQSLSGERSPVRAAPHVPHFDEPDDEPEFYEYDVADRPFRLSVTSFARPDPDLASSPASISRFTIRSDHSDYTEQSELDYYGQAVTGDPKRISALHVVALPPPPPPPKLPTRRLAGFRVDDDDDDDGYAALVDSYT
ncbi:uncharacterized protein V1510DRAFT_304942 [Dipodascopsis tothii]|uniref:uncharacterized protein n=1 Tax=Dipodascopsis tothii TaxID=44089 RepID=UPI0034CD9F96